MFMEENITAEAKKRNMWIYALFIILIIGMMGSFMLVNTGGTNDAVTGNAAKYAPLINSGDVQKIVISMKNYNYYPNIITVKAGKPVSITLDSSVQGCLRSFIIKDLGVRGHSNSPSKTIDFTPTQKGSFGFSCPMGMGYGTIIIE